MTGASCALCTADGVGVIWADEQWRIVLVDEPRYPVYYRVIANTHVAEFSELSARERVRCMELVTAVEAAILQEARPDKVNLAALGNMVPHLHWHVVGRFSWDDTYPAAIWSEPRRVADDTDVEHARAALARISGAIRCAVA